MTGTSTNARKNEEFWNFLQCPTCGGINAGVDTLTNAREKYICPRCLRDYMLSMRRRDELQSIFHIGGYLAVVDLLRQEFQDDPTNLPTRAGFVRNGPCLCASYPRWTRPEKPHRCKTSSKGD